MPRSMYTCQLFWVIGLRFLSGRAGRRKNTSKDSQRCSKSSEDSRRGKSPDISQFQSQDVQICPGLNANEIQIPYDKHHKVPSLVKRHQNTHNSVKHEVIWKCQITLPNMKVLIEQYLHSIRDISKDVYCYTGPCSQCFLFRIVFTLVWVYIFLEIVSSKAATTHD